jgi:succinate dehydrogenase/fumarate reductase flavoprotein subunit
MIRTLNNLPDGERYDIAVVGAGAAGMAAAIFAAIDGKKVLLVERTEFIGGTSAVSAATTWIPNTFHSPLVAVGDSYEAALQFLHGAVGNYAPSPMREAFLRSGPEAVALLEAKSDVHFRPYATHPDYEQQFVGATMRGRALEPMPLDGRLLGDNLKYLRPPIPEFTIFGGMMVDRTDIGHLLNLRKSWKSFSHAARILGRYGLDRMAARQRGTRLVMGNALTGRMLLSLLKKSVDIVLETAVRELLTGPAGVVGLELEGAGTTRRIGASRGVILAAGGFARHPTRRAEMLPEPTPQWSPAAPGHTGAAQDLAIALGARFGEGNMENAFWAPVSIRERPDGSTAVFPHFVLDRSKPGTVCVNQAGRRFVNESTSYHLFGRAMFDAHRKSPCIPCFIVTDAVGLRKYGLGMVRMGTRNIKPHLDDGYLVEGRTIAELATKLKIDPATLEQTVADMNRYARTGVDPEFGRGTTPYHRVNGDASHGPNPTLGPIDKSPFYAVRLYPGDIGAAAGLVTNEWAQVLGGGNQPIGGLYACGNEANSIMGGVYPAPGITIGPAIVFAYRAISHASGRQESRDAA